MSNHASLYCKTLSNVDPAKAINAIHAAYMQLSAMGMRPEVDGTTYDNLPVLISLHAILVEAGHVGFGPNGANPMLVNETSPAARWLDLRKEMLTRINKIDNDTPWSEVEPRWWLGMMEAAKTIREVAN